MTDGAEKRLRERYLDLALEESLRPGRASDLTARVEATLARREVLPPAEHRVIRPDPMRVVSLPEEGRVRQRPWWLVASAAVILVMAWTALRSGPAAAPEKPAAEEVRGIQGVVRLENGRPVAGAHVKLELGWAGCDAGSYVWWKGVEQRQIVSGAEGRFAFAGLPDGATGMLHVAHDGLYGFVRGAGELEIVLREAGSVRGHVAAKKRLRGGLKVWFRGPHGLRTGVESTKVGSDGSYTLAGLPAGPGEIVVQYANWVLDRRLVVVAAGKATKARTVRVSSLTPKGPDPLVDAREVRMVDGDRKPLPRARLIWSSPWMDGAMNADAEGILKLVGGGVAIGAPPFVLRLGWMSIDGKPVYGTLGPIRSGTATVVVRPRVALSGTVRRGETTISDYAVLLRTGDRAPRAYEGKVVAGRFTVQTPPGKHTLLVILPSGDIEEATVEVEPGEESRTVDVDLGR